MYTPATKDLVERAFLAATTPRGGRTVPELARDDVREVFVRSCRITYRIAAKGIVVQAFVEGHQQLPDDLDVDA